LGLFYIEQEKKETNQTHNRPEVYFLSFVDYLTIACKIPQKDNKYFIHFVHPLNMGGGGTEIKTPVLEDNHLAGSQLLCNHMIKIIFRFKIAFSYEILKWWERKLS